MSLNANADATAVMAGHHKSPSLMAGHTNSPSLMAGHGKSPPLTAGHAKSPLLAAGHDKSLPLTTGPSKQSLPLTAGITSSLPLVGGYCKSSPLAAGHDKSLPLTARSSNKSPPLMTGHCKSPSLTAGRPDFLPLAAGRQKSPLLAAGHQLSPPFEARHHQFPPLAAGRPQCPPLAAEHRQSPPLMAGHDKSPSLAAGHDKSPSLAAGHNKSLPLTTGPSKQSLPPAAGHSISLPVTAGHGKSPLLTAGHTESLSLAAGHSESLLLAAGHNEPLLLPAGHDKSWPPKAGLLFATIANAPVAVPCWNPDRAGSLSSFRRNIASAFRSVGLALDAAFKGFNILAGFPSCHEPPSLLGSCGGLLSASQSSWSCDAVVEGPAVLCNGWGEEALTVSSAGPGPSLPSTYLILSLSDLMLHGAASAPVPSGASELLSLGGLIAAVGWGVAAFTLSSFGYCPSPRLPFPQLFRLPSALFRRGSAATLHGGGVAVCCVSGCAIISADASPSGAGGTLGAASWGNSCLLSLLQSYLNPTVVRRYGGGLGSAICQFLPRGTAGAQGPGRHLALPSASLQMPLSAGVPSCFLPGMGLAQMLLRFFDHSSLRRSGS